jgi:hypothetical protein
MIVYQTPAVTIRAETEVFGDDGHVWSFDAFLRRGSSAMCRHSADEQGGIHRTTGLLQTCASGKLFQKV